MFPVSILTCAYSVIALSNLYRLNDSRLSQIMVRGDLIVPKSDRIMTRSRARQSKILVHAVIARKDSD
jgi:hypothetical protein